MERNIEKLRILFFCQSLDQKDPVIADTYHRVMYMAQHPDVDYVKVVAVKGVGGQLSDNVEVFKLDRESSGRVTTLINFYKITRKLFKEHKFHISYLYMIPMMAPLFFPFKFFYKTKVVAWFAHTIYRVPTRVGLRLFSDRWLSVNKAQAELPYEHIRLVGQGVEVKDFFPIDSEKKFDLITVGRITPLKKIHQMIDILDYIRKKYKKEYTLQVCGAAYLASDKRYLEELHEKVKRMSMEKQVLFIGSVPRSELNEKYNQSRMLLFTVPGGVGKAALESLACGIPMVLAVPSARDFFGDELGDAFLADDTIPAISKKVHSLLEASPEKSEHIKYLMKELLNNKCTMTAFTNRVVENLVQVVRG